MTADLTITQLCREANEVTRRAGWQDEYRSVGDLIVLMHSELSEAFEEYRNGKGVTEVYCNPGHDKPEGVPIELADTVIRIAQFCGEFGIDLEDAIRVKMAYNETRGRRWEGKKL